MIDTIKALQMSLQAINKQIGKELTHHSDRGLQYSSSEYIKLIDGYHIDISMTENSDPLETPLLSE